MAVLKPSWVGRCVSRAHWQEHSRPLPGVARVFPILLPASISLTCEENPRSEVDPQCQVVPVVARDPAVAEAPVELQLHSVEFLWPSPELLSSWWCLVDPLRAVSALVRDKSLSV